MNLIPNFTTKIFKEIFLYFRHFDSYFKTVVLFSISIQEQPLERSYIGYRDRDKQDPCVSRAINYEQFMEC